MQCVHMKWILIYGSVLFVQSSSDSNSDTIDKIQKEYWAWRMEIEPEYGTYIGIYKFNDIVHSYNTSMFETRKNKTEEFLERLNQINPVAAEERINYMILKDTFQAFVDGYKWAWYGALNPMNFLEGIQLFYSAVKAQSNTRGDFENYIARIHATVHQIDEIEDSFREAIRLNRTYHNVSIAGVPGQIDKLLVEPIQSSFYTVFNDTLTKAVNIPESEKPNIRQRGEAAVREMLDAYRKIKNFIINEYMPNTRSHYGVNGLEDGEEYYKACLKWHLSVEMTPEQVHETGLKEVDRIHTEMKKIMLRLGHDGSIKSFFGSLVNDSRFYSNDSDYIIQKYNDIVFKRINPMLPKFFKDIPDIPLQIKKMTYDGPGGGYSSASETSPGVFSVNLFRPLENPSFDYMALSLHEANPGHHLQHSYAMKANLPDYRRHTPLSFYNVPLYFPWYSAYSEGWALYSEFLGVEMGLYADDYEMMGRYSNEMLRACRLVVDTGLHYFNWDKARAIEYMLNYTSFSYEAIEIEVNRYITWPGQACAYKIGEIKVKELRNKAEKELGTLFDLRDFHSVVLTNGAMPMSVLELVINEWIEVEKKTPVPTSRASGSNMINFWLYLILLLFFIFP